MSKLSFRPCTRTLIPSLRRPSLAPSNVFRIHAFNTAAPATPKGHLLVPSKTCSPKEEHSRFARIAKSPLFACICYGGSRLRARSCCCFQPLVRANCHSVSLFTGSRSFMLSPLFACHRVSESERMCKLTQLTCVRVRYFNLLVSLY